MAGMAEIEEVAKAEKGIITKIREMLSLNGVKKDFNAELAEQELRGKTSALISAIFDILEDDTIDKVAAIKNSITQFQETITKSDIAKAGRVISDANMNKITSAIKLLQEVASAGETAMTKSNNTNTIPIFLKRSPSTRTYRHLSRSVRSVSPATRCARQRKRQTHRLRPLVLALASAS